MRLLLKRLFYILDEYRSYNVFDRPVFIISAPRSGSTFLYELILQFDEVWGYSVETDDIWWKVFPRERLEDRSDWVGASDCDLERIKLFRRQLYRYLIWSTEERGIAVPFFKKIGFGKIRYVEKTIANCFHLEALEKIFFKPNYIWLIRDPRATYSSMLVGWKGSERAKLYKKLDPLKSLFTIDLYPYPLPPRWNINMQNKIEAIAFLWALEQFILYPLNFFNKINSDRFIIVRYEDLIDNPVLVLKEISKKFSLKLTDTVINFARKRPLSRTTVLKPSKNKWKKLHGHLFEYPEIRNKMDYLMKILGYNNKRNTKI